MKGKEILNRNGFRADIVRNLNRHLTGGCSYSIYVPDKTDEAEEFLKKRGFKIIGRSWKEDINDIP